MPCKGALPSQLLSSLLKEHRPQRTVRRQRTPLPTISYRNPAIYPVPIARTRMQVHGYRGHLLRQSKEAAAGKDMSWNA